MNGVQHVLCDKKDGIELYFGQYDKERNRPSGFCLSFYMKQYSTCTRITATLSNFLAVSQRQGYSIQLVHPNRGPIPNCFVAVLATYEPAPKGDEVDWDCEVQKYSRCQITASSEYLLTGEDWMTDTCNTYEESSSHHVLIK